MPDPRSLAPDPASSTTSRLLACPECDLLMRQAPLAPGQSAQCVRCGYVLHTRRRHVVERSLALVLAALLLFGPANFLPIMYLNLLGRVSSETVWSGVVSLYQGGMVGVAAIVFLCSMAVPLLKLLCQLFVLLSILSGRLRRPGILLYRGYHHLRDWGMLEVYLLGILVSMIKLRDMADLGFGFGLFCFVALLLVQLCLELVMSPEQIWEALDADDESA